MYESHVQHNVFHIQDSEIGFNARKFSRSMLPEIMHLSSELTRNPFKPLLNPNEPFPDFLELLDPPKLASDSLFSNFQHSKTTNNMKEVNKLMKANKRLLMKIESILTLIQTINYNKNPSIQETNSRKLKLFLNRAAIPSQEVRRMTDEELRLKLENEKEVVLDLFKSWKVSSASHKSVIDAMENYKKLVTKYVRRFYRKENSIDLLRNLLSKAKNDYIVGTGSSQGSESLVEHNGSKKRNKKQQHIWTYLNLCFMDINEDIKSILQKLRNSNSTSEMNTYLLNMNAINRLSAIAKMLQYCLDNGTTVAEFMDNRTYQKIKARFKRIEETALLTGAAKEKIYCPSLDEIPFLLLLGKDNVESTFNTLKNNVTSFISTSTLNREEELKAVSERNKKIMSKLNERINQAKEIPQIEISPIVYRKRYKKIKRKRKRKKQKVEDSESDTNTTPKEYSLKATVPQNKPKFRIQRIQNKKECIV